VKIHEWFCIIHLRQPPDAWFCHQEDWEKRLQWFYIIFLTWPLSIFGSKLEEPPFVKLNYYIGRMGKARIEL